MHLSMLQRNVMLAVLMVAALAAATGQAAAAVWQWSVPAASIEGRRAFLWIPPNCRHVRGLIIAVHNMLEKPLFERPAFRAAAAENGLGILLVFSGHDRADDDKNPNHPRRSALDIFLNPNFPKGGEDPKGAGADLQNLLNTLADESGYSELRYVPLMPVGHSSAGSFVWHLYRWDPSRIFAMMPFKTGAKDDGPEGIPVFEVNSEWFDYGSASNRCWAPNGPADGKVKARNGGKCLYGYYVDIGSGHCDASDDAIPVMSVFLKNVVAARIPADAPLDGPVHLNPVAAESGWVIDPAHIGRPDGRPMPYADWKGNPAGALWYVDQELAERVQKHMAQQLAKKPQQINFFEPGKEPSIKGGTYNFTPRFLDDAGTFRLEAAFIDQLTKSDLYPGVKLGHGNTPILYRVNSGAVMQVGPSTFRILPHAGPIRPQGNPWEPTMVAYTLGDDEYRPTERPAHANVSIINTAGKAQTLDFLPIANQLANQLAGSAAPIPLTATASSGLPVEFDMVSGPAELAPDGKSITLLPIPPRTSYPVRVLVEAFQWGRPIEPKVRSVGPIMREFFIYQNGGPTTRPPPSTPESASGAQAATIPTAGK